MNTKEDYVILPFEDKYKEEILSLVSEEWDKFDESYFIWKFFKNPYSNIVGYVVLFKKKVVGFRGLMGTNFMLNGKYLSFLSLADGVIHKNHRRKGLFTKINNHLLSDLYNHSDVRLVYTMSSTEPSSKSYLKRDWKILCLKRPLVYNNLSGITMGKGTRHVFFRRLLNSLSILHDSIFRKKVKGDTGYKVLISKKAYPKLFSEVNLATNSNKIKQQKDANFYKWKLANPQKEASYTFSYLFNHRKEIISYLIFSVRGRAYHLIDYAYKNSEKDFIFLLYYTVKKHNSGFFFTIDFGLDYNLLKRAGFFKNKLFSRLFPHHFLSKSLPVVINKTNIQKDEKTWKINDIDVREIENWSIKMIDSD